MDSNFWLIFQDSQKEFYKRDIYNYSRGPRLSRRYEHHRNSMEYHNILCLLSCVVVRAQW